MERYSANCAVIALFLLIVGCASPPMTYKPVSIERIKTAQENNAATAEIKAAPDEAVNALIYEKKAQPRRPEKEPIKISQLKPVQGPVTINVNRMQLPEFVIFVLGETLKIPFVMDQDVMIDKRAVTLQTPEAIPADKALEIVISVLEKHDLSVDEKAGGLYVMKKPPVPKSTSDVRIGRDTAGGGNDVLQVIPLRHVKAADLDPLIKDVVRGGVQVKPYARENVLILHGNSQQMRRLIDFIDHFDVPSLAEKKLMLLRLTYWPAEEFVAQMTKILEGMSFTVAKTSKEPGPVFVPIRQMNGILVVAPDEATLKYILGWKDKLDTAESAGSDEKAYTFAPQYTRASDLVNAVLRLYGVTTQADTGPASGGLRSSSPSRASGRYQTSQIGSMMPSSGFQGTSSGAASQSASGIQSGLPSGFSAPSSSQTTPTAGVLDNLKITADNNKNVVIMICPPAVYRTILGLLRQLDTQTKQVLIEATIAELSLTDELKYGVEWYINTTIDGGPITGGTFGNLGINTLGMTFNYVTATAKFKAMLNAFASKDKANILSTPRLTVLDNHEAVIQIGQDVPIVTGEQTTASSTTTNPTIQRSIEYRSLGIILRVKPTINTEGLLTLELAQEVSDLSTDKGVGDSPIILVRKVNTSVVAAHGQTVALGGLMKESKTIVENKVPFLGDIPLIGNLFKVRSNSTIKTELLVLVTPTILTNTDDATKITEELKKELQWIKF